MGGRRGRVSGWAEGEVSGWAEEEGKWVGRGGG